MLRRRREAILSTVGTAAAHGAPGGRTGSSAHSAERCRHLTPLETTSALWTGTSDCFGKQARARETSGSGLREGRTDLACGREGGTDGGRRSREQA